jgi:hypothetical protein
MFRRLTLFAVLLATLAGCYVAPVPPRSYGYHAPAHVHRPHHGGWGHRGWGHRHW